jgi:hypothetical protein
MTACPLLFFSIQLHGVVNGCRQRQTQRIGISHAGCLQHSRLYGKALQLRITELQALQLRFGVIGQGVELVVFVVYGNHGYRVVGRHR